MTATAPIRNIIFDLGGVLIDIDIPRTESALQKLGIPAELSSYSCALTNELFLRYEMGTITSDQLRQELREMSGAAFSDEAFDQAWCAMLLGIPADRVHLLHRLNKEYRVFLLSNTSEIHSRQFERMFLESAGLAMSDCFEKRYYSFETGLHKPEAEAFMLILRENGLNAEECLFIDDTKPNVLAAEALGIKALHLEPGMQLTGLALFN